MQQVFLGGKYLHVKNCYEKQQKILEGEMPTYAIHTCIIYSDKKQPQSESI